jgi:hypothetical protein
MEDQNKRFLVTGMFTDRESAERAYQSIKNKGYSNDDVHLIMSEDTRHKHFSPEVGKTELGNKALEGAGTGSAIGGTLGAIAGAIAAIGTSLLIPGLGIVVAGPLAAAIAGAGAGGVAGGIIGALVGAGIPEARARVYEKGVKEGNIVIGVRTRNDEDAAYFEDEWRRNNAIEIHR